MQEQQARLQLFLELFKHPGWKQLMKDASEDFRAVAGSAIDSKNSEELFFTKGRAFQLRSLLALEREVKAQAAQIEQEDAPDEDADV